MTKFNPPARTPVVRTTTHEGAPAYRAPTLAELAFTAACTYAGEDTFYESAQGRLDRLVQLTHDAVDRDPTAVAQFVGDLRDRFLIRSASIVVAAEYARRVREAGYPAPAPMVRQVVSRALRRADEPAELVAYWQERYGVASAGRTRASLPSGVRKGLADAVVRLYTPQTAVKWNSHERRIRMGDVIELTHPIPRDDEQRALFRLLLDERHRGSWSTGHDANRAALRRVVTIANRDALTRVPEDDRRELLRTDPRTLWDAGFTWEHLSSWLPGGMDAAAWEAIIPRMGVMALLRNLRNFDDAGVSDETVDRVIAKITTAEDVEQSRIMPYRAYTAYQFAPSDTWRRALGRTLDLASASAPRLDDSLFVIDVSGSMQGTLSRRSQVCRAELAALQAVTVAKRSENVDVVLFADTSGKLDAWDADWRRRSALAAVQSVRSLIGVVGYSTYGHTAIQAHFDPDRHRRVVLFTDDQMHDDARRSQHVPEIITFNLGGYQARSTWGRGRVQVAGFSDQVFKVVAELVTNDA